MKTTVLVKAVQLVGPAVYHITYMDINYGLNNVPTAQVIVSVGYNARSKEVVKFNLTDQQEDQIWQIQLQTATDTFVVFKGYIKTVTVDTKLSVVGSAIRYIVTLTGIHSKLNKYGGKNLQYFAPGCVAGDTHARTSTGCVSYLPNDSTSDAATAIFTNALGVLAPTIRQAIWWSYGSCLNEVSVLSPITGSSTEELKNDLETLFKDPANLTIRPEITSLYTDGYTGLPDAVIFWTADQFTSNTVLEILFSMFTPERLLLNLAPRVDCFEVVSGLPWGKNPDIVLNKKDLLSVKNAVVLKTGQNVPEAIAVLVNNTMSYEANRAGFAKTIVTYPYSTIGTETRGGSVQLVTVPAWLLDLDKIELKYGPKGGAGETVKIKNQEQSPEGIASESVMSLGSMLAKAYFGFIRNSDVMLEVRVPWYRLDLLNKVGQVVKIEDMETVPAGGLGTVYGVLRSVQLNMAVATDSATISLTLVLANVRNEDLNNKYALEEHPIWVPGETVGTEPVINFNEAPNEEAKSEFMLPESKKIVVTTLNSL